jgi:hypothetical protein
MLCTETTGQWLLLHPVFHGRKKNQGKKPMGINQEFTKAWKKKRNPAELTKLSIKDCLGASTTSFASPMMVAKYATRADAASARTESMPKPKTFGREWVPDANACGTSASRTTFNHPGDACAVNHCNNPLNPAEESGFGTTTGIAHHLFTTCV